MTWQQSREAWISAQIVGHLTRWHKGEDRAACACIGPRNGEPLCGCAMANWYTERTAKFVLIPIIEALKHKGGK